MIRSIGKISMISLFVLGVFLACGPAHSRVLIKTGMGDITVEVYENKAPITAVNFLRHVDEHHYDGAYFYRVVRMDNQPDNVIKIEVIQGGLDADDRRRSPIGHETTNQTGILHRDGVISMARLEPGTATTEFFICVGDQLQLDYGGQRNPDGQGFAAFGKVIDGMDVVKSIHRQPADGQRLNPRIDIIAMVRVP